jgi:nucleoid-associated protein YgaU
MGLRPRPIGQATPVLEYRVKKGDRLDLLSLYFYNNDRKWWRILDANSWVVFGADLSLESCVGEILLIPALIEQGGNP